MSTASSWYHEKESAWLYQAAAAAEGQAACWRRVDPGIPDEFWPALRARVVAGLLRRIQPRHLRPVLAA